MFTLVWPRNVIAMSGESNFTIYSVINYVVTFYVRGYSREQSEFIILSRERIASGVRFRFGHKSFFLSVWYPQLPSNKA